MGNAINFPKNYEVYLLKAIQFLQKGNLEEAEGYIEKAYSMKQGRTASILYTSILSERGKYAEAKKVADDHLSFYDRKEENQLFYLTLLVKLRLFIQAESFFKKWEKEKPTPYSNKWIQMEQAIDAEKEVMLKEERKSRAKIAENLNNLGLMPLEQQISTLQSVGDVPQAVFQKISRSLLLNPYVANEAKTVLIHLLIEQEANDVFQMLWFDTQREFIPSELGTLDTHEAFHSVHEILEKELSKNPSLLSMIQQEVDRHFFQLYPYIDDVVTEAEKWTAFYLEAYNPSFSNEQTKEVDSEMKEWFDRLTLGFQELE